jgi:hypothetical protein
MGGRSIPRLTSWATLFRPCRGCRRHLSAPGRVRHPNTGLPGSYRRSHLGAVLASFAASEFNSSLPRRDSVRTPCRASAGVCVNESAGPSFGKPVMQICQTQADYGDREGDSAAPVFLCVDSKNMPIKCPEDPKKGVDVRLVGIHRGGVEGPGTHDFSPIGSREDGTVTGVQNTQELGPLTNCFNAKC